MKTLVELSHCILLEEANGPRRKQDYSTLTDYLEPYQYMIVSTDRSKVWTINQVKFLSPFKSFILNGTGEGFKTPLEAAMWVNDHLAHEVTANG